MSVVGAIMVPHPPILLPEVGRGEEKKIAASDSAYRKAAALAAELRPDTIVLSSPHSMMYADYFHISPGKSARGDMGQFRAPQLRFQVSYDEAFTVELSRLAEREGGLLGTDQPAAEDRFVPQLRHKREECCLHSPDRAERQIGAAHTPAFSQGNIRHGMPYQINSAHQNRPPKNSTKCSTA